MSLLNTSKQAAIGAFPSFKFLKRRATGARQLYDETSLFWIKSRTKIPSVIKKTLVLSLALGMGTAFAKEYPSRPITVVVPFSPGGVIDVATRIVVKHVAQQSGAQVVVENKSGGEGVVGAQALTQKNADGYALLAVAPFLVNTPLLRKNSGFATEDFVAVGALADSPFVLVTSSTLPVKSFKDLVAYGLANPDTLNAAMTSEGGTMHMGIAMFMAATGVKMRMIPFKGAPAAVPSLVNGEVQVSFLPASVAKPLLESGRIHGIAVAAPRRLDMLPDIPTLSEAGATGEIYATTWIGLVARRGTDPSIITWWNTRINDALKAPEVIKQMTSLGILPTPGSNDEFAQLLKAEKDVSLREFSRLKIEPK